MNFTLYRPATAIRLHFPDEVDRKRPVGDNPPKGALLDYYLKTKPADKEEITIEIFDAQGKRVRRLSNRQASKGEQPPEWPDREKPADLLPADAGMNRFPWDFRYDAPAQIPGAFYVGDPPRGPLVMPGSYQVKLTVKGKTQTAPLEVKIDPRLQSTVTAADMQKQIELGLQGAAGYRRAASGRQPDSRTAREPEDPAEVGGDSASSSEVVSAARSLDQKMTPVEEKLIQVKMKSSEGNLRYPNMLNEQYASFNDLIQGVDGAPTVQQALVFEELHGRLEAQLSSWRQIEGAEVPALNEMMRKHGVPTLAVGSGQGD